MHKILQRLSLGELNNRFYETLWHYLLSLWMIVVDLNVALTEDDQKNGRSGGTSSKPSAKRKPVKPKKDTHSKDGMVPSEFSHSWLIGTLKGHTGPVRSLSMSSNNHLLASTADGKNLQ